MSLLHKIDGIPVFYRIEDAISFGAQYNLTSVHKHTHGGRTGYMPGNNHAHAVNIILNGQGVEHEDTLLNNWANDDIVDTPIVTQQQVTPLSSEENTIPQTITPPPSIPSSGGGY